ncbi:hypothetical protein GTY65_36430 [Streptomyces sp. SID8379]|uniref:hypothetical protein n=1 Tax=unclassified Streptomyces TaxID=2593676 RepID=UPI00037677CB|nr:MULTISPECIES: hypothetical protein [unclassified Streptomyces]MYW69515.1 hypothetical protein [Streptomyces sp. SID8379]
MPREGIRTDTQSLSREGTNFQDLGSRFAAAAAALQNGLASVNACAPTSGEAPAPQKGQVDGFVQGLTSFADKADMPPWGDDEIGEKFGIAYEGLQTGMFESMNHLAQELTNIGGALAAMAKNHDENESFNEELIRQQKNDINFAAGGGGTVSHLSRAT